MQSLYTVLSIGVGGGRGKGAEALTIFFKGGRPPIFDSNYSYYMYTPIHHLYYNSMHVCSTYLLGIAGPDEG